MFDQALKNAGLTLLGGLIEPSSEFAQPIAPNRTLQNTAGSESHPAARPADDVLHNPEYNGSNKYMVIGGMVLAAVIILILLFVLLRGSK